MTDKDYEEWQRKRDTEYLTEMVVIEQKRVDAGEYTSGIGIGVHIAERYLEMEKKLEKIADLTKSYTRELQDHNGEWYTVVPVEYIEEELG